MPATTKKPIKIVPNTIKTIPKVPLSPISKSKSFQEKLNDIQNNIDIDIDDIPEDLLDIWDELQEDITPKLISKNYKLWLTIFTPFILPGIINGMSGKPAVPQPVVTVQEPAPDPKQIVNFAQKYFAEHGLELCKSLTKTDLNSMKQDLINNWGKGPDAFSKTFQDSYPVSKSRLENIYRSERHLAEYNGVLERAKIADHKYKQWRAVGDERSCDLCMSHDMEIVPIEEPFSNGEMTAMGHPQCRCSMVTYSDEDYDEMKENSAYIADVFESIKQNYNCPDDEKIGSGPGSCSGGNTSNLDKVSTLKNKIRELEKSVSEGKSTFDEAYEQYKSIQKELDLELEKEKLRNPDNAKITNDIVTDPEPITPYKALSDYQNYAYTAINDYLRKTNHVKQNPQQTKNIQNMIKTIDSEMENNPLKSDKLVFRADSAGISSDAFEKTGLTNIFKDTFGKESLTLEDFIKNHKLIDKIREKLVGYEYTEKAYLSTGSDKENTMNRFLAPSRDISKYGVTGLINLIVPKGTPAIRIADYTGLEDELGGKIDEYLIGRDQTIVIDQVYIRPADDNRLYLEYNAHIKTNEQKQNSEYLEDVTNFIKLNYKCKAGTVDDSNKCEPDSDSESSSSNNNHIESYSRVLQSKVPEKFGNQVYLVRMGSEKEDRHNITGNVFVGNDINMLIKKALESSKESGNLIIGRCSKDAFEDDELDKISKNNFIATSKYLGQSFSPVDVVIDTGTSDTIYKRSKDELEKEKNLFDTHELQLNKIEQNTALSNYRNFGYQSINNILRKNYVIEGENKKSALDPTPVYSKEYIDKALKDASLISDAMEPSKENKTLSRVDGAAITATLFPVAGITEELTNYFKKTYEKSSKYPKAEDILFDNIKPPSEKTWNNYLTTKLKGLEFKDPAFLSTSKSESGIKEDLLNSSNELSPYGIPSLLKIEVPKGTRLVDMQERLGIGEGRYKTEKEVLLDKNTIFKIKSVKLEPHDNGIIARIMVRAIQKLPEPIKENSTSNNILVYFENNPIRLMDTDYLSDAFETIKQNYKCKAGTVDDSNKCGLEQNTTSLTDRYDDKNTSSNVIAGYVRNDNKLVNSILAGDYDLSEKDKNRGLEKIRLLDNIFKDKLLPKKEITYRGISKSNIKNLPDNWNKIGNAISPGTFLSTSRSRSEAEGFITGGSNDDSILIKLILPRNTNAINVSDFVPKTSAYAYSFDENEVLVDRNIEFKVVDYRIENSRNMGELHIATWEAIPDEQKQNSVYLEDVTNFIKLNYNCPDSEKIGSGPGSCGGNTDSKIDINPEIAPADYNSFFENFNKISKDKSEPDRVMRRLNAETVQRRFYRKTEEHFNEIKPENDKKLKENGEKLWDNLRPEVQSAIKSYTTQDYGVINSALQDDIIREEVSLLKEATSKPLGVSTILYRGINFKMPKDIFKVGATWIHKPFASCSTGSFIAEEAARGKLTHITPEEKTILQIFTEPETKGFAVGKNSFHAGADAGSEVILDAGTKFQTIHSEKRGGMRILTVRAINDKQKQDSSYLEDAFEFIKLNYKCPKGTVDDSNKCEPEQTDTTNIATTKNKKELQPLNTKTETFNNFKYEMDAFFKIPAQIADSKLIQYNQNISKHPENIRLEGMRLIHRTGSNNYQKEAREQIISEITNNTQLGKYLNDKIMAETKAFEENPVRLYRSGKYKNSIIESFTTHPNGAFTTNFDDVPPGNDFHKDYDELKTDGWKVLSGVLQDARYPEEYEVTLINTNELYKNHNNQKQNSEYLEDVSDFIKLNYKCPKGTVNDSNKCNTENESLKNDDITVSNKNPIIIEKLTDEVIAALRYYTDEGYRNINHSLRHDGGESMTPEATEHMEWIDAMFEDKRAILTEGVVYRGYNSFELSQDDVVGSTIKDPAFVSVSNNESNANIFIDTAKFPVMAEIHIPDGSRGLAIPDSIATLPVGESEILLPRDSKFKITKSENKNGIKYITMDLITDRPIKTKQNSAYPETYDTSRNTIH